MANRLSVNLNVNVYLTGLTSLNLVVLWFSLQAEDL